jgi:Skp family chaperone for outer membrane proteins
MTKSFLASPALAGACVLGLCILGAAAVASHARANAAAAPAPFAPKIGLVNLELMNRLTEFTDRNKEIQAHLEAYQTKINDTRERAKAIATEIETVIPRTDLKRRAEKLGEKLELEEQLKTMSSIYQRLINLEQGDLVRELYLKLTAEVKTLAQEEGYDLILLDDSSLQIPERATAEDFGSLLRQRNVIYRTDALDISDLVLTRLNNAYAVKGRGG